MGVKIYKDDQPHLSHLTKEHELMKRPPNARNLDQSGMTSGSTIKREFQPRTRPKQVVNIPAEGISGTISFGVSQIDNAADVGSNLMGGASSTSVML